MSPQLQSIYHKYYINNPKDFIVLLELIKDTNLKDVSQAIDELSKIKNSIVNTDNIKNILFKSPLKENLSKNIDSEIKKSSIDLISEINNIFNFNNEGNLLN